MRVPEREKRRIKKGLAKYSDILKLAVSRDINESDTSNIVNDMLGEVFGYDKFFDVTTEYKIRGQYADYGIRLNDKLRMIIEVKAVGVEPTEQHLYQAVSYAANEGVEWVALTNGHVWQLYHVNFAKPIDKTLVFSVDILDENISDTDKMRFLYLPTKESLTNNVIGQYWKEKSALSADNIASVLFANEIIDKMRQELKQLTGYLITPKELKTKLKTEVIRAEIGIKPVELAQPVTKTEKPIPTRKKKAA